MAGGRPRWLPPGVPRKRNQSKERASRHHEKHFVHNVGIEHNLIIIGIRHPAAIPLSTAHIIMFASAFRITRRTQLVRIAGAAGLW